MIRRNDQRGVALLTMMLIAALATMLIMLIIERQGRVQRELGGQLQQDQIAEYNRGAALFAMAALRADAREGTVVDHPGEGWAQPFPAYPVPGGLIQPTLRDAQARFNLNSVIRNGTVNAAALGFYRRLLAQLLLPPELADSLVDWLDSDREPSAASGAEDDYYLGLNPPYRTANRAMSTYGELRLVRGYNSSIMRTLAPWVVVLPPSADKLNVNFLTPGLLEAMVPGLAPSSAVELLQNRPAAGWESVAAFLDNPLFNGVSADIRQQLQDMLAVKSGYFELYTRIRFGDRERLQWSLIARRENNGKLEVIANERNPAWVPNFEPIPEAVADKKEEGE